jgi:hypothetical protein
LRQIAVVTCGAIAAHVAAVVGRRGWAVDVHPLPPLLHNRPERIAAAVEERVRDLLTTRATVAVAYADCGTHGALDEVCARLGVPRLRGSTCYDAFAGAERMRALLEEEPGTYVLTDYLALSFDRSVVRELGMDRHPELREEYFRHYRRVVWLAQHTLPRIRVAAERAAAYLRLPLEVVDVGEAGLERELEQLLSGWSSPAFPAGPSDPAAAMCRVPGR